MPNDYIHSNAYDDNGGAVGSVYHSQKIVYHIDEPAKSKLVLANAQNHLNVFKDLDAELTLVVLANADGFGIMLKNGNSLGFVNEFAAEVEGLAAQGAIFEICNNTMKAKSIQPTDLLPVVNIIPAGVATLTELQMRGFAYIRP